MDECGTLAEVWFSRLRDIYPKFLCEKGKSTENPSFAAPLNTMEALRRPCATHLIEVRRGGYHGAYMARTLPMLLSDLTSHVAPIVSAPSKLRERDSEHSRPTQASGDSISKTGEQSSLMEAISIGIQERSSFQKLYTIF